MTTQTPDKTAAAVILTHQEVTHPDPVKGSAQDVSAKFACRIDLFHALVEAAANTNPGSFLVQVSGAASGDNDWKTVFAPQVTNATPATEAMTATEPIGETVLAVASTTGVTAENEIYIQDTTTIGDSEWRRVQSIVANTSIDIIDGLTVEKDSADVIWGSAEHFFCNLNLATVQRVRVIYQHEGAAGANAHVKATISYFDSVTAA